MRNYIYALSLAAVMSMPAWAQQPVPIYGDPCPILHGDNYRLSWPTDDFSHGITCISGKYPLTNETHHEKNETDVRLAAQTIADLRTLIAEIRGLRAEMREYQQKLAQAKAEYDIAIKTTTASQESWQAKALNDTLESVEKIPARLALDKNLREALLTSLKDELPKDSDFIETLRQRTTP